MAEAALGGPEETTFNILTTIIHTHTELSSFPELLQLKLRIFPQGNIKFIDSQKIPPRGNEGPN